MESNWRWATRVAAIATACSVTACSTPHATFAPDGRRGYSITCGGYLSDWSACLVKAGRACGTRGYDMIEGSEYDRSMLIACRAP